MTDWTDSRLVKLKQLFDDGYSGSTMAEQLGVTRTSALRKCELLGWKRPTTQAKSLLSHHAVRRAKNKKKKVVNAWITNNYGGRANKIQRDAGKTYAYVDRISGFDRKIPKSQRRQLLDLAWNECRYPIGAPGYPINKGFFCGAPQLFKSSYCPHHHKVVWNPPRRY